MDKNKQFYVNVNTEILESNKYYTYGTLIYLLLLRNLTLRNRIIFSINDLSNKLKVKQTNGRMLNKIKENILIMNNNTIEIFNDNYEPINDIGGLESNKLCVATLKQDYDGLESFKIYDHEIDKLLDYIKATNVDKFEITLCLVYLYSKSRTCDTKGFILDASKVSKEIRIQEGDVYRYSKILKELGLIDFEVIEYWYKDKKIYNSKKFNNLFYYSEINDKKVKEDTMLEYQKNNTDKIFNEKEIIKEGFTEEDLEDFLVNNLNLIEDGLKFISRQYTINNGFIDILARDKNNKLCIIELKVVGDCKDLVFQCVYYPTQFDEPTRMITICPRYQNKIKESLNSLDYVEMYKFKVNNNNLNTIKISKILEQ